MKNFLENYLVLPLILIIAVIIPFSSSIAWFLPVLLFVLMVGSIFFFILLKDIEIGILLVVFLLPFEQIGGFEVAGMNLRLSQVVFMVTFVAWFLKGLYRRDLKIKIDFKLSLLFAFLIVCIASLANTINMFRSTQILLFIIFVFAVYIFFSSYKLTDILLKKIVYTLFFSMVITCAFGVFQFVGDMIGLPISITGLEEGYTKAIFGFPRIQSTANEPLNYANYLLLPIGIAFAFFAEKNIKTNFQNLFDLKRLSLPILVLSGIVLILTFSRGGWGGAALIVMVLGLIYLKNLFTLKNIGLGLFVATVSLVGIFGIAEITHAPFTVKALLDRMNITDFSAQERVRTTNEGLEGWKKTPLIGIGIGAYGPFVAKYRNIEPEGGWQTVNNEYAELLIETGVIGLSVICIFWLAFFVKGFSKVNENAPFKRAVYLGMLAALAGMLLQYISFSTLYVFHLWFLLGFLNNDYFVGKKDVLH